MTHIEFTSLMTTSVGVGILCLTILAHDPLPPKAGSVCMVAQTTPEAAPAWACGLPASKVANAAITLPGTPVRTTQGENVGVVFDVGTRGQGAPRRMTIRKRALQSDLPETVSIDASEVVLLEDQNVLLIGDPR